ncbi:uncharacterized protein LOC124809140 [Hydra vulgaris]|uniref:uncharacterized protein LOC124809140 n=1 Tax=Hydra vulgaris TaxID=6087 RepID=UPI001F5E8FFB|nr:uncharacterized protein LOC124809140 [Hydra vulgaris]
MSSTSKEGNASRVQKYRMKKKAESEEFQKRENARTNAIKKNKRRNMSQTELKTIREYERDQKRKQRERKQLENETPDPSTSEFPPLNFYYPYNCPQTYAKVLLKATESLPTSPNKRNSIISGLVDKYSVKISDLSHRKSIFGQDDILIEKVKSFYFRPDIVYTGPGMKDTMVSWKSGKKETLHKFYLTVFLREGFFMFKEENPDLKIGFTKFTQLRPENVVLLKDTPKDQCRCKIHENFTLKLKALQIKYENFWQNVLCDQTMNSICWKNECFSCMNLLKFSSPDPEQLSLTKIWKKWDKDEGGRLQLILRERLSTALSVLFL